MTMCKCNLYRGSEGSRTISFGHQCYLFKFPQAGGEAAGVGSTERAEEGPGAGQPGRGLLAVGAQRYGSGQAAEERVWKQEK